MLVDVNEIVSAIAKEASKLNPLEQKVLLTKLKIKRLKKKDLDIVANIPKGVRKATLKQIDKWKHESRAK